MEFAFDPESLDRLMNIESHDIVFWMGDLNYRIHDASLSTEKIKQVTEICSISICLLVTNVPRAEIKVSVATPKANSLTTY